MNNIVFKKTHDLSELFIQVTEAQADILDEFKELETLTDYAVEFRYDLIFEEEQLNRKDLLIKVEALFNFVNKQLTTDN